MKIPGRTFVYSMLFMMTAINYLDRVNLSVAANTIAKELGLTPIQLGWIFSAFLWSYIVILIPAGYLADRFGARRLAPGAVAFWSLATASTAAVTGIIGLMAARICLGTGEAAAWPVGTKTVRAWAPRSEYGLAISAISLGQSFGVGFGALFVGWLVFAGGWRMSFVVTGAIGLVWALVWVMTIRDPKDTKWLSDEERAHILKTRDDSAPAQGSTGFASLLKSPSLWALTLAQGCLVYAYYMLLSWLPNYLQTQRGIAVFGSGLYTAIIYGTAVAGAILLARVDRQDLYAGGAESRRTEESGHCVVRSGDADGDDAVAGIDLGRDTGPHHRGDVPRQRHLAQHRLVQRSGAQLRQCQQGGCVVHLGRQRGRRDRADRDRLYRQLIESVRRGICLYRRDACSRRDYPAGIRQGRHRRSRKRGSGGARRQACVM